ncbi:MAG: MFS transporter [Bryobacterales bacterium]|nr:MFS transporter [Bryobacteraceae bacterium]MDW8353098.1 MFS transporter [Bryobacterales bacterium]
MASQDTAFLEQQPRISLRESPQRWALAALLVSATVFCYAQRAALSVAAPFMMKELGLSRAAMGVLLSAFFWSYSLMQVPAGWFVDRFGVRRAYALGFGFWSLASAATAYAANLAHLILVRILLGVGQSAAFPASARAVANWFPDRERGTVTGLYLMGVRLGQALISAVGGFFLAAHGWKAFFLTSGLVPMLWLAPWWLFLRRWDSPGRGSRTAPLPAARTASFLEGWALLGRKTVLGIFLGFFAFDYTWFLYVTWLPGYLVEERKFSSAEMGIYSSIPFLVMSVVILVAGMASDWLIRRGWSEVAVRKGFITAGLTIACLIVPAGLVEDKMTAVWLLGASLCGLGLCSPNTWTLTQAVCGRNIVGTVSGIQNFGGNLGGVLAPMVTGFIAHSTGSFALALGLTGLICLGGIASYLWLVSERVELR